MKRTGRRLGAALAAVVGAAAFCACGSGNASSLLTSNGTGPQQSAVFEPEGPWVLSYKWDCTSALQHNRSLQPGFAWDTINKDDDTLAADHPHGEAKGKQGSGTARYPMGGAFAIDVTSACDWMVEVKTG